MKFTSRRCNTRMLRSSRKKGSLINKLWIRRKYFGNNNYNENNNNSNNNSNISSGSSNLEMLVIFFKTSKFRSLNSVKFNEYFVEN